MRISGSEAKGVGVLAVKTYRLTGKSLPASEVNEVPFFELCFELHGDNASVSLSHNGRCRAKCRWSLWQHTIHEIESLLAGIALVDDVSFPEVASVEAPFSPIGGSIPVHFCTTHEMGYNLRRPRQPRVYFFLEKRRMFRSRELWYVVHCAVGRTFIAFVLDSGAMKEFEGWLLDALAYSNERVFGTTSYDGS